MMLRGKQRQDESHVQLHRLPPSMRDLCLVEEEQLYTMETSMKAVTRYPIDPADFSYVIRASQASESAQFLP